MTWNPTDGGTYEKTIAHLTVDKNGKRGDEPGFDKTKVEVYGLGLDGGRRAASARPSGACTPAPPAGPTPTRTRGAPTTTTTTPSSRRPSAGAPA